MTQFRVVFYSICICVNVAVCSSNTLARDVDPFAGLFKVIMTRQDVHGKIYGLDSPVPLLWNETDHLLEDVTYVELTAALDAFDALSDEQIAAYGNVKRAWLQRSLWAVFDWATVRRPPTFKPESPKLRTARLVIQSKVANLVKRLALTKAEILALPNTLEQTTAAKLYPTRYDPEDNLKPFLPADVLIPDGPWVCLMSTRGDIASVRHTQSDPHSIFQIFMRTPGTRRDTLNYLRELQDLTKPIVFTETGVQVSPETPQFPVGTQFAVVERPLLISDERELVASPMVYSAQFRAYLTTDSRKLLLLEPTQALTKFVLDPRRLFRGAKPMRALGRDETHVTLFFSNDPFQRAEDPAKNFRGLDTCKACHSNPGIASFLSRGVIGINAGLPKVFQESTLESVAVTSARDVKKSYPWGLLEGYWRGGELPAK